MQTFQKLDTPDRLSAIFHPRHCEITPLPEGAIDLAIETKPGISIGCRLYIHDLNSPNVLFFHGNGENIADYDDIGPLYNHVGVNLLVMDYRGYGWSTGTPTVASMLSDAEVLYVTIRDWLDKNNHAGAFFLMGRSLGSIPAIDLASRHKNRIKGLIIESGIANTIPLVKSLGLNVESIDFTEKDGFQNLEKIATITIPTFILHGARDEIIAADEAENLQSYSGARTKEFVIIPGASHNTMILTGGKLYFQTIKKFIDKVSGHSDWRNFNKRKNKR